MKMLLLFFIMTILHSLPLQDIINDKNTELNNLCSDLREEAFDHKRKVNRQEVKMRDGSKGRLFKSEERLWEIWVT